MSVYETIELSQMERDVIMLAAAGKAAKEIGKMMGKTEKAIYDIRYRIQIKFNAKSMTQVVADALRMKIIE